MQTYEYRARGRDGAPAAGRLKAAGREAALAALRARGLTPLELRETRRPDAAADPAAGRGRRAAFSAVASLLAVAAGVWLWTRGGRPSPARRAAPRSAASDAPARAPARTPASRAASRHSPAPVAPDSARPAPAAPPAASAGRGSRARPAVSAARPDAAPPAVPQKPPPVFRRFSERQIAGLLQAEPGDTFVGTMDYGPGFVEDFRVSLSDGTPVLETDTPEVRELKLAVEDVKRGLAERMAAGEDVGEIMSETRAGLQELGIRRMELENEYRRILAGGEEEKEGGEEEREREAEAFRQAANKVLEEHGVKPIRVPALLRRRRRAR